MVDPARVHRLLAAIATELEVLATLAAGDPTVASRGPAGHDHGSP